jgi:hypothetical protein
MPIEPLAIPFPIRETAAVTVFASLTIAHDLLKRGKIYPIALSPTQIGQIALVRAQLFSIYKQLIHQDVPNQHAVLETICVEAQTEIENLTAIVAAISATPASVVALIVLDGRLQSYAAQMAAVLTNF